MNYNARYIRWRAAKRAEKWDDGGYYLKAPTDDLVGKERVVHTHDIPFPCKDGHHTRSKEARKSTKQNI